MKYTKSQVAQRLALSFLLATMQSILIPHYIVTQVDSQKNTNYCCMCKKESIFEEGGVAHKRPQVKCPHCKSLERHRSLYLYLQKESNLFTTKEPLSLLHFSPNRSEELAFKRDLSKNVTYITSNLSGPATINLDITKIDLPDNSIDVFICYHVLEHVTEDQKAIKELLRILRPNGYAIIAVPLHPTNQFTSEDPAVVTPEERTALYGQDDHVRYYGQADFENRLKAAGFHITEIMDDFLSTFSKSEIIRQNLVKDKIYLVTK